MDDKDTAAASLVGISEVACRKLNRLAWGGAGPQPRGGGWRGARLIGFAPESDYTFPTAAPPFLFTCGLLNGSHTPWRAPVFTARLEAGGCRLEAGGPISGFKWRPFNCQLDLPGLPLTG